MTAYATTIPTVRAAIDAVFRRLDAFFDLPAATRTHHPTLDSWSVDEILEHVTLTSKFLLIVIENSTALCVKRAKNQPIEPGESDLVRLEVIGHPDAFPWLRPEHMEPTRAASADEVRATMREQHQHCLDLLAQLPNGEGSLHKVRMSVQELGKLDVYQWLFFLSLHAQRHAVEIERILAT